jgi:hypothetical protein
VLPVLEPFLAENVAKEIRKDALVIEQAGEALREGAAPGPERVPGLLAAARAIDREFLGRVGDLPARIEISYARIEPVRRRRIEISLETAHRILAAWQGGRRLRAAFAPGELERKLFDMLRLYADETLALSHSVKLPRLLEPLRARVAGRLRDAMLQAASSLTGVAPAASQNG